MVSILALPLRNIQSSCVCISTWRLSMLDAHCRESSERGRRLAFADSAGGVGAAVVCARTRGRHRDAGRVSTMLPDVEIPDGLKVWAVVISLLGLHLMALLFYCYTLSKPAPSPEDELKCVATVSAPLLLRNHSPGYPHPAPPTPPPSTADRLPCRAASFSSRLGAQRVSAPSGLEAERLK